jgi:hypothetical protein
VVYGAIRDAVSVAATRTEYEDRLKCSLARRSRNWLRTSVPTCTPEQRKQPDDGEHRKRNGRSATVVVGRGSAASETGALSSSSLEGRRRDSKAGVLFCDLLLRPSRVYTLWLSGGWRAAEVAEGRRGSELLRCCLQSAFPESPLPHLLIEHALATSVMEFGRRESICIALECRDERLGEYVLHFCCVQRVNVFASSGKRML